MHIIFIISIVFVQNESVALLVVVLTTDPSSSRTDGTQRSNATLILSWWGSRVIRWPVITCRDEGVFIWNAAMERSGV